LADFAPLAEVKGAIFYSLQKGARQEEAQNPPANLPLIDLAAEIKDLTDLAALMEVLDLLITVDTAPAHVAGAMGKNVWTLLPHAPDWRWMIDRTDSPWYPTMRLFRQAEAGNWAAVISQVREALTAATR
jgi:ADP-heptose:LPS heptosyltransferase